MEKSKHDYELEIQTLKQQLMETRDENGRLRNYYEIAKLDHDSMNKQMKRMSKLIEILLDKLEREEI